VRTKPKIVHRSQYTINFSDDERRRLEFITEQEAKARSLRYDQVAGSDVIRRLLIERSDALGFKASSGSSAAG
jgi:hypothetical protein